LRAAADGIKRGRNGEKTGGNRYQQSEHVTSGSPLICSPDEVSHKISGHALIETG